MCWLLGSYHYGRTLRFIPRVSTSICMFRHTARYLKYVERSMPCRGRSRLTANGMNGNGIFPSIPPTSLLLISKNPTLQDKELHNTCRWSPLPPAVHPQSLRPPRLRESTAIPTTAISPVETPDPINGGPGGGTLTRTKSLGIVCVRSWC